jgi:hypothetical protein
MDSPQTVLVALAAFFVVLWIPIVLFFAKGMHDRRHSRAASGIARTRTGRGGNC